MQAEKKQCFFFFGASLLIAQWSPDFGQRKRIISFPKNFVRLHSFQNCAGPSVFTR
jgi:hypothetical protein